MPEGLLIWRNEGVEPPESLKDSGWEPAMKPSAQHMNWLFNRLAVLASEPGVTVEDVLTSLSTENALSAYQGNVINKKITTHLDQTNYLKHRGSLKNIDYTARVYADGDTTDKPISDASFYVDVMVRPDLKDTHRKLVAYRSTGEATEIYQLEMVNGIWASSWTKQINVNDIINNLTSDDTNKPVSARQAKMLKTLIDNHLAQTFTQSINTQRNGTLAGQQIVSGFIAKPKFLLIDTFIPGTKKLSRGQVGENYQKRASILETGLVASSFSNAVVAGDDTLNFLVGTVTINNDNTVTINWTKTGNGVTGTIDVSITAFYH